MKLPSSKCFYLYIHPFTKSLFFQLLPLVWDSSLSPNFSLSSCYPWSGTALLCDTPDDSQVDAHLLVKKNKKKKHKKTKKHLLATTKQRTKTTKAVDVILTITSRKKSPQKLYLH